MSATLSTGCQLALPFFAPSGTGRRNLVDPANYALTEHGTVPRVLTGTSYSASFPGTAGNFLSLPPYAVYNLGDASWSWLFWVKFAAVADGKTLLCASNGSGGYHGFRIFTAFGGYLTMTLGLGDSAGNYLAGGFGAGGNFAVGTWYPVYAYYDKAGQSVGIKVGGTGLSNNANAQAVNTTTSPVANATGQAKLRLGTQAVGGATTYADLFNGEIANVNFFNRTLTTQEWSDFQAGGRDFIYPFGGNVQSPPAGPAFATGRANLSAWSAALAKATTTAADVAVISDSTAFGTGCTNNEFTRWPEVLGRALRAVYGGAGSGLWPASNFPQIAAAGADLTTNPTQRYVLNPGNNRAVGGGFGVKGYNYGILNGQTFSVLNQYGDTHDIYLLDGPDTSACTVQIDSGTPVSIGTTQASYGINRYRVTSPSGFHTVKVSGPTSATAGLYTQFVGTASRVGNTGVHVHTYAYSGANANDMVGSANLMSLAAALPNLKLVILGLTINDWGQQTALATYQATLDAAIRYFQALPSPPSVALAVGNPGFSTTTIPQASYNAVCYTLANTYNCAVLDFYQLFGSGASAQEDGLMLGGNNVHPADNGYSWMGQAAAAALTFPVAGGGASGGRGGGSLRIGL